MCELANTSAECVRLCLREGVNAVNYALPHISWINEGNFVLDLPSCMLWACTYLLKSPLAVHKDMFPLLVPFLLGLYQGSANSL